MSDFYQDIDKAAFDYDLQCLIGIPGYFFRGPAIDASQPYIACIGGAQTYGRFCARPFPALLGEQLGVQVLNLGLGGAGPRLFDKGHFLQWLNNAELVIVQVFSGRSEGNSQFDNSESGDLFGTRLADGKRIRFEDFLSELVANSSAETVKDVIAETRENYVKHTLQLLEHIHRPKILLWISNRTPAYQPDYSSSWGILGSFPQLVDDKMIEQIRAKADAYVECSSNAGLPQKLWPGDQPVDGTMVENGFVVNYYYPSPEMHIRAAELLAPVCQPLMTNVAAGKLAPRRAPAEPTRFLILSTHRCGSNLLVGLLNSHSGCFVAGELFNEDFIEQKFVPWFEPWHPDTTQDMSQLNRMREDDPVSFVDHLFDITAKRGYEAIGFKLMYYDGDTNEAVRDHLVSDPNIRVIHVRRRNHLRRYLSWRRAEASQVWWASTEAERGPSLPSLTLSFQDFIWNVFYVETKEREYAGLFKHHEIFDVTYEELAEDPQTTGSRIIAFLGLSPRDKLDVRDKKTGVDPLRKAIENYDEMKSNIMRWVSFFDE